MPESPRPRTKYPNCTKARYYRITEINAAREAIRWHFIRCHQKDCPRCQSAFERAERMLRRRKSPLPQYKAWQHAADRLNESDCSVYLCYGNLDPTTLRHLRDRLQRSRGGLSGYFVTTIDGYRHFFVDHSSAELIRKHLGAPSERGSTTKEQIATVMELGYKRSGGWGFWQPKFQKHALEGISTLWGMPSRACFAKKPQQKATFSSFYTDAKGTLKGLADKGYTIPGRDPEQEDRPMAYRDRTVMNQIEAQGRRMDNRAKRLERLAGTVARANSQSEKTLTMVRQLLRVVENKDLTVEERDKIMAQIKQQLEEFNSIQ